MAAKSNREQIHVGLDLGSSKITAIVGQPEGEDSIRVIGVGFSNTTGLRKGIVNEVEETVSGISEAVEIAERMAGVPIDSATVNINGAHINSVNSRGVIAVGRADKEISVDDLIRVEEAAQAIQMPSNREILHVIPRSYSVDGQSDIKDPLGMTGVRLEVETHIVTISQPVLRNLTKCVSQAGVNEEDLILSPLAASRSVLSKRQMELGCILIDIGAGTTGICVYEEGQVLYSNILPVGSGHITNDIAIGLRTSIDIAEKIKVNYGEANHKKISSKEKIDLSQIDMKEEEIVLKKDVSEIIEARLFEIFRMIRDELRKISRDGLLPAGAILVGGGARLTNISDFAKEILNIPVIIGYPKEIRGISDKVNDPMYATALGLMLYSMEGRDEHTNKNFAEALNKIKKVFKTFLP